MELNHAIGILSKLKDNAILKCLENNLSFIIWLPLGPKTWGQKTPKTPATFKHYKTIPFRKLPLKNAEILLTCIYLHDKFCLPRHDIKLSFCNKTIFNVFSVEQNPQLFYCLFLTFFTVDTPTTTQQDQLAKTF